MKEIFASVDKVRRIVLPRQVIEALALAPGDVLSVYVRNAKIILRAQKRVRQFIRKGRALVLSAANGAFLKPSGKNNSAAEVGDSSERVVGKWLVQVRCFRVNIEADVENFAMGLFPNLACFWRKIFESITERANCFVGRRIFPEAADFQIREMFVGLGFRMENVEARVEFR